MQSLLNRISSSSYMLLLIATVVLAAILPVSGMAAKVVSNVSYAAVALLFFLYGAKLKTQAVVDGIANWRFQLLVVITTFAAFPVIGLGFSYVVRPLLPSELVAGFLFLCILPSTVQSSIALTAMARGNVPAAICAASLSNLLGVVVTPALALLFLSTDGLVLSLNSVLWLCIQLLLPFVVGQLLRPWIGKWIEARKQLTLIVDRGSILLIVYSAFSAGVVAGVWTKLEPWTLAVLIGLDLSLFAGMTLLITRTSKALGLPHDERMSLLFCGSQKSLASGVPIANVLFVGHATSMVILPLMIYHQLQLLLSTVIAQRSSKKLALAKNAA